MKNRLYFLALSFCFFYSDVFSQPGLEEMKQVRTDLRLTFLSAIDASFVLAAVFGITSAITVFNNWQMGKPHMTTAVANWFYAALFMVLMGAFLKVLFGI